MDNTMQGAPAPAERTDLCTLQTDRVCISATCLPPLSAGLEWHVVMEFNTIPGMLQTLYMSAEQARSYARGLLAAAAAHEEGADGVSLQTEHVTIRTSATSRWPVVMEFRSDGLVQALYMSVDQARSYARALLSAAEHHEEETERLAAQGGAV